MTKNIQTKHIVNTEKNLVRGKDNLIENLVGKDQPRKRGSNKDLNIDGNI